MTSSFSIHRFAGGLLRSGVGLFAFGLVVGCGLISHYFYVTPFAICSASLATASFTDVWPWAMPLLAVEGFALALTASGLCLLAHATSVNHAN
jgi:hypothetical protein